MAEAGVNINTKPNIRIEIRNDLMEVDDDDTVKVSDGEEGEIIDDPQIFDDFIDNNITYLERPTIEHRKKWPVAAEKGFTTGVDIFDELEQKKLSERAKRFALEPDEISTFTQENLHSLHQSLGVTDDTEKNIRFEAVHMHGTEEMSAGDVLEYFMKFGPSAVEWINDECCNVLWEDQLAPTRALFYLSKPVKGMPAEGSCNPFADNYKEGKGRSILLKNDNRQVELDDAAMADDEITLADIKVPVPPGYWRLGVPHVKAKCILLRFAMKTDKKPYKAERFSEYYKKHGNPNYGGLKGLISESKKAQLRGIFERNKEINSKNPWGQLAKSWNRDPKKEIVEPQVVVEPTPQLKQRLGFKRSQEVAFDPEEEVNTEKSKVPRMRMYADEEEAKIKRKKALEAIKRLAKPTQETKDLRNVIRHKDNTAVVEMDHDIVEQEVPLERDDYGSTGVQARLDIDLGKKLMNRRLKFTQPPATTAVALLTAPQRSDASDMRQMIDKKRFRSHRLHKRLKSPPPPARAESRHDNAASRRRNMRRSDRESEEEEGEMFSDDENDGKTNSKVQVVIKTQKQPTVASTVWSRVRDNAAPPKPVKDRLQLPKTSPAVAARKSKVSSASSGASSSSSSGSNSSSSSSSSSSSESGDESDGIQGINDEPMVRPLKPSLLNRPGFRSDLASAEEHKSPLRIEINNDLCKK